MRKKYDMTFDEAQQLASRTNLDTYWNDGDIYIDRDHITQTIGNVLQFGMDYQKEMDDNEWAERLVKCETRKNEQIKKALIDKAIKWISYTEDNNGFEFDGWEEDFRKFMED